MDQPEQIVLHEPMDLLIRLHKEWQNHVANNWSGIDGPRVANFISWAQDKIKELGIKTIFYGSDNKAYSLGI